MTAAAAIRTAPPSHLQRADHPPRPVDLILCPDGLHVYRGDWIWRAVPEGARRVSRARATRRSPATGPDIDLLAAFAARVGPVNLVDLGANYGQQSVRLGRAARARGMPLARHVAVEPGPAGSLIADNMALHGLAAEIQRVAVGAAEGECGYWCAAECTTGGALYPGRAGHWLTPVPVLRWDTLAARLGVAGPTFFKVDLQGMEREFQDFAAAALAAAPCAGVIEFAAKDGLLWLARLMRDYHVADIGHRRDRRTPVRFAAELTEDVAARPEPWTDLIFWPRALGADFLP